MHTILYNWQTADRSEAVFFSIGWLNELRISLTDTTHVGITVSETPDSNLRHLGLLRKTFCLAFFQCFLRAVII